MINKVQEECNLLREELKYAHEAAKITASLVVSQFEEREKIHQRLIEQSIVEQKLREELQNKVKELESALLEINTLSGLLPICASCKKIRDDKGYWNQIESYIMDNTEAEFSHSICNDCAKKLYPEFVDANGNL
jgi:hypothetical protein